MEGWLSSETVVFVTDGVVRGHNERWTDRSVACCVGVLEVSPSSSIMENTDSDSFLLHARYARILSVKIHPLSEYLVLLFGRAVLKEQNLKQWG